LTGCQLPNHAAIATAADTIQKLLMPPQKAYTNGLVWHPAIITNKPDCGSHRVFGMRITHANGRLTSLFSLSSVRRSRCHLAKYADGPGQTHTLYICLYTHIFIRIATYIFMYLHACRRLATPPGIHVLLQLPQRHVASSSCDFAHDFLPPTQAAGKSATPATAATTATTTTKAGNKTRKRK